MAAPSAVNQQPWEFYVVTDKAVLEKLAAASPYAAMTAKAPAAIVLCSRTENILVPELVDVDMAIATENILLEIEALGLGGVMLGIIDNFMMTGNNPPVFLPQKRAFPYRRKPLRSLYEKIFLLPYTLFAFGDIKNRKQKQHSRL